MKVEVQTLDSCRRLLQIEIPAEDVRPNYEQVVREFVRNANIPGFRKGKAPRNLVERRFASSIEEEFRQNTISRAYREAVKAQGLSIVSVVSVENVKLGLASGLSCDVTVDVTPEFELPEYRGIPVKYELAEVNDEDVDQHLSELQRQMADYEEATPEHELTDNDVCLVSIQQLGQEAESAEVSEAQQPQMALIEFREGALENIPGIKDALKGAKVGEKRELEATYPADHPNEDLAGKTIQYEVTPSMVRRVILKAIDDELARTTGHETLADLKETLRKNLEQSAKNQADNKRRNDIMEYMLNNTKFELPKSQFEWELKDAVSEILSDMRSRGIDPSQLEDQQEELAEVARNRAEGRVRTRYILSRIADLEEIEASQREINLRIGQMAQSREVEFDKMAEEIESNYGIDAVANEIRRMKALDLLENESKTV